MQVHEEEGGEEEITPWRWHQCFDERIQNVYCQEVCEQVSLLINGVNKLKSKNTIFDKLPNEVMSNLYVSGSRMLNRILRDFDGTSIVRIDGEMLLTNTLIMKEFLHP